MEAYIAGEVVMEKMEKEGWNLALFPILYP